MPHLRATRRSAHTQFGPARRKHVTPWSEHDRQGHFDTPAEGEEFERGRTG